MRSRRARAFAALPRSWLATCFSHV
jgi:hypothetical protein